MTTAWHSAQQVSWKEEWSDAQLHADWLCPVVLSGVQDWKKHDWKLHDKEVWGRSMWIGFSCCDNPVDRMTRALDTSQPVSPVSPEVAHGAHERSGHGDRDGSYD